jgi:hypothetical protein
MQSFDPFLAMLREIPDPRRAEGMLYKLPYVLLFSILAVVTGGNSFRSIETFIRVHRHRLDTSPAAEPAAQAAEAEGGSRHQRCGSDTLAQALLCRPWAVQLADSL